VLVLRAGALGDTVMVTPLIRRLHDAVPGREVDVLCSAGGAALLRTNPYISRLHVLRLRNLPYFLSFEKLKLVKAIRERHYEFAVVLESAKGYRELLERASIPDIRGFAETPFDPAQHSIVNNLRAGGFANSSGRELDMDLPVSPSASKWATEALAALPRPWVGVHAGYGPLSKKKNQTERLKGWTPDNFIEVSRDLTSRGASIILTGSQEDRPVCEAIAQSLPQDRVLVCAGQTSVEQLVGVIHALDLLVSVDSGPAHMAAALGTPLVVLWGPAILSQVRPLSTTTPIRILNANVPCAPCYGTPLMKECRRNICMEQITPFSVVAAAVEVLSIRRTEPER
jgi:ADP-heptose:LPS heptosyltransferase